jgi:hypothetical protein
MRALIAAALLLCAIPGLAQTPQRPPDLQPVPEPPPAPPGMELDPALEPQVTIRPGESGERVEEYRIDGRLYMMKVYPRDGPPFYLVDDRGDGRFNRVDSFDFGTRPPMWVIHTF